MVPARVSGTSRSGRRARAEPSTATMSPPSTNTERPPCARCATSAGRWPSTANRITPPGQAEAIASVIGSAALSTAKPVGATFCTITRLSTARSSTVVM